MGFSIYEHLIYVRDAAIRAECARNAIRAAEEKLTRISGATTEGVRVACSGEYDRMAMRVHALQETRKRRGKDLSNAVRTLKRFRAELDASGLGDDEQSVLWLKYVRGLSNKDIAKALDVEPVHVWPMLSTARRVLARSLGAGESDGVCQF